MPIKMHSLPDQTHLYPLGSCPKVIVPLQIQLRNSPGKAYIKQRSNRSTFRMPPYEVRTMPSGFPLSDEHSKPALRKDASESSLMRGEYRVYVEQMRTASSPGQFLQ